MDLNFRHTKAIVFVCKEINHKILAHYNKIDGADKIVVCPNFDNIDQKPFKNFTFIPDSFFLEKTSDILSTSRPNWYFQQFLKYQIVLKIQHEHIHIIDGDSILKDEFIFFEEFLYTSKRLNSKYNLFISGFNPKMCLEENFIVNHMYFRKSVLQECLNFLGMNESTFVKTISSKLKSNDQWFSEYQLYAAYNVIIRNSPKKQTRVFRRFDLISAKEIKQYSLVSYEHQHNSSILHRVRASILYFLGLNHG
jgi:hypothetical protein